MIEVRPIGQDEIRAFLTPLRRTFGLPAPSDEEVAANASIMELDRTVAIIEDSEVVGTGTTFSFGVTVPGGATVPMAGATWFSVRPGHRGKGIMNRLMRAVTDTAHERDEPLLGGFPSRATLYHRYGHGISALHESIDMPPTARLMPGRRAGATAGVDLATAEAEFPDVWDLVRPSWPGIPDVPRQKWAVELGDPTSRRMGHPDQEFLVHRGDDGRATGAASFRVRPATGVSRRAATLHVQHLFAATPDAFAGLWHSVLERAADANARVTAHHRPLNEPLRLLLENPRDVATTTSDSFWLRIVEVGPSLAARDYAGRGRLILQVIDGFCPWNEGRFAIDADGDQWSVARTTATADLIIDVADLAVTYLNGGRFRDLLLAGRIDENRPGAVAAADALFATGGPPWCPMPF
jgi:predicted acetyltransferase